MLDVTNWTFKELWEYLDRHTDDGGWDGAEWPDMIPYAYICPVCQGIFYTKNEPHDCIERREGIPRNQKIGDYLGILGSKGD